MNYFFGLCTDFNFLWEGEGRASIVWYHINMPCKYSALYGVISGRFHPPLCQNTSWVVGDNCMHDHKSLTHIRTSVETQWSSKIFLINTTSKEHSNFASSHSSIPWLIPNTCGFWVMSYKIYESATRIIGSLLMCVCVCVLLSARAGSNWNKHSQQQTWYRVSLFFLYSFAL